VARFVAIRPGQVHWHGLQQPFETLNMTLAKIAGIVVAAASVGMAGCAIAPTVERQQMTNLPFAAAHSDIAFILTTGSRQGAVCADATLCQHRWNPDASVAAGFAAQVQRIAGALQNGARNLYPDLAQRIPALAYGGFDVYVATGDGPGSASSAGGRIALSAALAAMQPTDDWLAFVIAREMGHVIARHHEENSAASIAISVVMNVLLPGSGLLKSAASTVGSQLAAGSKRGQQALEADAIAVHVLDAAGFRLRDVALSLVISPAVRDDGAWSEGFRQSSDKLVVEVRGSKFRGAHAARPPDGQSHALKRQDPPPPAVNAVSPIIVSAVAEPPAQSGTIRVR
jgi:Zn-dependent protease with chaperone function